MVLMAVKKAFGLTLTAINTGRHPAVRFERCKPESTHMAVPEPLKGQITREPDLGSQVGELQSDVAAITGTLAKLAERRVADIREDAQQGMASLMHEG